MFRFLGTLTVWLTVAASAIAGPQVERWRKSSVLPHRAHEAGLIADRITTNRGRYQQVASSTRVPWSVIAGLHNMEASGSFKCHLHEGSPLTARTRYVPKGRPKTGSPPFTWEYSATDALNYDKMGEVNWGSLEATLWATEKYNGQGYEKYHPETPSPYLWAGTSIERPGKYVADGKWSPTARSSQIGVVVIWKVLEQRNLIALPPP